MTKLVFAAKIDNMSNLTLGETWYFNCIFN